MVDDADLVADEVGNVIISFAAADDNDFVRCRHVVSADVANIDLKFPDHPVQRASRDFAFVHEAGGNIEMVEQNLESESGSHGVVVWEIMGLDIHIGLTDNQTQQLL